jgi:hypothetical protein
MKENEATFEIFENSLFVEMEFSKLNESFDRDPPNVLFNNDIFFGLTLPGILYSELKHNELLVFSTFKV